MEELRKLEKLQKVMMLMESRGISTNSSSSSNRFLTNLILFMVQPCGELDYDKKCELISEYMPKISAEFLGEASLWLSEKGNEQQNAENILQPDCDNNSDFVSFQDNFEETAMVGLDAMQKANSTLEDFCRSYFMFHGMDVNEPEFVFKYLPILSFTESFIYQLDIMNERIVLGGAMFAGGGSQMQEADQRILSSIKSDPFRRLLGLLQLRGLLTARIIEEFRCGEEYWELERKLCSALMRKKEILVEDVMHAIHLKSFDYRVLNLLLYQLRGEKVNELHMDFLSVSEFLVEIADDFFDYEDDVLENSFNILRMFVKIYGASAPAVLAKYITEAEEKYDCLLKALDPQLSLHYQKRCVEATKEGGRTSGHPLGTWSIPPLILDEDSFRKSVNSEISRCNSGTNSVD